MTEGDVGAVEDVGVQLLRAIRAAFGERGDPKHLATADLLKALNGAEEGGWGRWNQGGGMRPTDLAAQLKPFQVVPRTVKIRETDGKERTAKGYTFDAITLALGPYESECRNPVTYDGNKGVTAPPTAVTDTSGYGTLNPAKSFDVNESYGVTAETPLRAKDTDDPDEVARAAMADGA